MAADAQSQYSLGNYGFAVPGMTFWGDSPTLLETTTTRDQTGISRIAQVVTKNQTGISRVTAVVPRTQTGISRITAATTRDQLGVSNITATTTRNQLGMSRIATIVSKDQTGMSRIALVTTRNQTGVSRVTASATKNQTGTSRVTVTTTRNQTGVSAVLPYGLLFSYENLTTLPTGDSNLANLFTPSDYAAVAATDSVYRCSPGSNTYNVFLFKYKNTNSTDNIAVSWTAKSDVALSTKTAYLQIYNYSTSTWETLSSNNTTAANTNFTLTGNIIASQANYYDGSSWIAVRGYQ